MQGLNSEQQKEWERELQQLYPNSAPLERHLLNTSRDPQIVRQRRRIQRSGQHVGCPPGTCRLFASFRDGGSCIPVGSGTNKPYYDPDTCKRTSNSYQVPDPNSITFDSKQPLDATKTHKARTPYSRLHPIRRKVVRVRHTTTTRKSDHRIADCQGIFDALDKPSMITCVPSSSYACLTV